MPDGKNKEDVIAYRLEQVELAVKSVQSTVTGLDNIKRADLIEFREELGRRILEAVGGMQKQVDQLDKDKVDRGELELIKQSVADVKSLIKAVAGVFAAVIAGLVVFYITHGGN